MYIKVGKYMTQNEEKRYKITKIQKIDADIDEAKKTSAIYATLAGIYSLMSAGFCIESFYVDNPIKLIIGGAIGALTIYKMTNFANVRKEITELEKFRSQLTDTEKIDELDNTKRMR